MSQNIYHRRRYPQIRFIIQYLRSRIKHQETLGIETVTSLFEAL